MDIWGSVLGSVLGVYLSDGVWGLGVTAECGHSGIRNAGIRAFGMMECGHSGIRMCFGCFTK